MSDQQKLSDLSHAAAEYWRIKAAALETQLAEAIRWVSVWKGRDTEAWNYLAKELGHDPNAPDPSGYHNAVTTFGLAQQAIRERDEARAKLEPWVDGEGTTWTVPTAWAYAQACKVINGRQLTAEDQRDALAKALRETRNKIRECFGGIEKTSAIWSNNPYCKGHTAGVLAALTAFDHSTKEALATLERPAPAEKP